MKFRIYLYFVLFLCFISIKSISYSFTENSSDSLGYSDSISEYEKVYLRVSTEEEGDLKLKRMMFEEFPIISDEAINEIIAGKEINMYVNDSLGISDLYTNYYIPANYLEPNPKILWELNIPEFRSRIYQIYNEDTLLITTWNNVVGAPNSKTYTGHYKAFRIRNWPSWKDPEKPESTPTPPGPGNPLGLFVVHYDENSLRYFHGTNKNNLLNSEYRALSHGCVRNDNANIEKMKQFIIKKVVKSEDLSSWADSKRSMVYNFKDEDKFPVRILYKTFNIDRDDNGVYVEFFKDCYGYNKTKKPGKFDEPELIYALSAENLLAEYRKEITDQPLTEEQITPLFQNLINKHSYNKKYYLDSFYPHTGQ